jgi:hypothetical protein
MMRIDEGCPKGCPTDQLPDQVDGPTSISRQLPPAARTLLWQCSVSFKPWYVEIYLTSPCLFNSRLLPIAKPTGGILPIAIGKVWYRLAALCALAARPDAGKSLSPLQLGVGIRGGSQVAGHALQAGIAADPGCITVQIDWQNAFNTLRRDRMLAAVEERCQALLPMVAWAYKQPSRLLVHQAPGVVIYSQSGVQRARRSPWTAALCTHLAGPTRTGCCNEPGKALGICR